MPKILIIEDDPDIAAIERDYLELSGYEAVICADGTAGLNAALTEAPKAAAPQAEKRHPHFGRKGKASVPDEQETTEERETVGSGKP